MTKKRLDGQVSVFKYSDFFRHSSFELRHYEKHNS
jgi:hypothetical protein